MDLISTLLERVQVKRFDYSVFRINSSCFLHGVYLIISAEKKDKPIMKMEHRMTKPSKREARNIECSNRTSEAIHVMRDLNGISIMKKNIDPDVSSKAQKAADLIYHMSKLISELNNECNQMDKKT